MVNIKINEIAIYHPEHKVGNDFYFEHFDKRGKDIRRLLEHIGRENRFLVEPANEGETSITMAVEASKKVLEKTQLSGRDLDMIVYSTQVPEQMVPMNALLVHQAIQGKNRIVAYDMNANCAGMTIAVEQASRAMLSNPRIKRALVVGSDQLSLFANPEDEVAYPCFGDLSVAVILEKTEEPTGFVDAIHYVDSTNPTSMKFPSQGLSNLLRNKTGEYLQWLPFDDSDMFPHVYDSIREILNQNNLSPAEVKCCFSQSNKANLNKLKGEFGFSEEQMVFVADQYGYTGTTSPFLALHEGVKTGEIKRGDYVLFWTVGFGYEFITMLFKY